MQIKTITVNAGRTFNHPYEQYSNLRPEVSMTADLAEGDDPAEATRKLQAMAEGMVEDHKAGLLKSIEELHTFGEHRQEVIGLQRQLTNAQDRLNQIRETWPIETQRQLGLASADEGEGTES